MPPKTPFTNLRHYLRTILRWLSVQTAYRLYNRKISRNQWKDPASIHTYQTMMQWTWKETSIKAPSYFRRLTGSIDKTHGKVLEIGCGIGTMTRWIAQRESVSRVWAADCFPECLSLLSDYRLEKVTPWLLDMDNPSLPPHTFDCVVVCEVLEHLYPDEEIRLLHILHKHIKPDSHYVVSVPIGTLMDPCHVRIFTRRTFHRHLRRHWGIPEGTDYRSGYSQVAWGQFNTRGT